MNTLRIPTKSRQPWQTLMIFLPKNIMEWRILNPPKSFDHTPSFYSGVIISQLHPSFKTEFTQRRRRRQREGQKSNRFRQGKQQLCTCITLFCTFLCRRYTTTAWNCLISRFVEDGNKRQCSTLLFFSWTLIRSLGIQLQKHLPTFDELITNEIE